MDFLRFVTSKRFLKHLLAALAAGLILMIAAMFVLNIYTGHNRYITVPDITGQLVNNVRGNEAYSDFQIVVMDSAFEVGKQPGTIVFQDPAVNSRVKHNRKVYVTIISSIPDEVEVPDVKYLTLRQGISVLESSGLKIGNLSYTRSFDEDAIQQQYFEGKPIRPGTKIYKGSIIDLVVGLGAKASDAAGLDTIQPILDDTTESEQ
jgi:beta-lactam-binding protein with PASTA domain